MNNCAERAEQILDDVAERDGDPQAVLDRLGSLAIETPSWGYGDTGTRFGKFHQPAAARTLPEKLQDAGQVHKVTGICPTVAVHVLWDFPDGFDPDVLAAAERAGVKIGAINPNVFQEQRYKYGSLCNEDAAVRQRALDHILDCVELGKKTDSRYVSLWFGDGTNYPGQGNIAQRKRWMTEGLRATHDRMSAEQILLVEYKPFEPAFYHTDIADWGMAYIYAKAAGDRARVLVDTGHHYQGQNVEQIVAWLIDEDMLGGFHFNDRRYADDDLTMASIDPYQAYRIFLEIVSAEHERGGPLDIAYMVDQSHNLKGKVEAMIQTVTIAHELFAKALLVDQKALADARAAQDVVKAEEIVRGAFFIDTRPLTGYVRRQMGIEPDALAAFRASGYEAKVAAEREAEHGPPADASYA